MLLPCVVCVLKILAATILEEQTLRFLKRTYENVVFGSFVHFVLTCLL